MHSAILKPQAQERQDREQGLRDVEQSIVSYLVKNPDDFDELTANLKPEYFKEKAFRVCFSRLRSMFESQQPIDAIQLELSLSTAGELDLVGGISGLARAVGGSKLTRSPSRSAIKKSIEHLVQRSKRERLLTQTVELSNSIADSSIEFAELVDLVDRHHAEFLRDASEKAGNLKPISETIAATVEAVIARSIENQSGEKKVGIPTGWADIDAHTGGWRGGKLIVIAARPLMGKSTFVANTLLEIAKTMPVALFSLEMTTAELEERYLAMESGINSELIRDGKLAESDFDRILSAGAKLSSMDLWGNDNFGSSIDTIISQCRKLQAKKGQLGAIAIDYLQLMCDGDDPNREIGKITRKLKALSIELNVPVFLLSQLNRAVEARQNKRPLMSDLRDSGSIEQDSDIVIMLYRDDYYNPDSPDKGLAEIIFSKFRNGRTGTVKLVFDGATTRFKNLIKPSF